MLWMFNLAKPFRVDWDATKVKGRLKYLSNRKPVGDKVEQIPVFSDPNLVFLPGTEDQGTYVLSENPILNTTKQQRKLVLQTGEDKKGGNKVDSRQTTFDDQTNNSGAKLINGNGKQDDDDDVWGDAKEANEQKGSKMQLKKKVSAFSGDGQSQKRGESMKKKLKLSKKVVDTEKKQRVIDNNDDDDFDL